MAIRNSTGFRNKCLSGASAKDVLEIGAKADKWAENVVYALNDIVVIKTGSNSYYYKCTTAGTSSATTEPTWPTTPGNTVVDGTVTWTCYAKGATVQIWSGTRPASPDDAAPVGAVKLVEFTDVVWASAASGGVLAIGAGPFTANALATGTAGWFRYAEGNDPDPSLASTTYARRDGTIAVSGGDMTAPNTSITSGAPQTLNSLSLTLALE